MSVPFESWIAHKGVEAVETAFDALDYLRSKDKLKHPKPNIIFLDINMPGMNGWEFLEEYEQLPIDDQAEVILCMLSTSLNPDDESMAKNDPKIVDFIKKPLTVSQLQAVLEKHFPNFF